MINSLFDVIKNITFEKSIDDIGSKYFSSYMVSRFMSMEKDYIDMAVIANRFLSGIPSRCQEVFFMHSIPKRKVFIKYIKSKIESDENIDSIIEETGISDEKAREVMKFTKKLNMARNGLI